MYWENVWYNHSIRCIVIKKAEIEYIDGEIIVFDGPEAVGELMLQKMTNNCEYKA